MFKKKLIIKFESVLEEYPDILVPSKSIIPEWYKKIPSFKNKEVIDSENNIKATLKLCTPFLDSLSSGYMILLPYDIHVRNNNGLPFISWKQENKTPPSWRNIASNNSVIPTECYPTEYTWNTNVAFEIPKGYSVLLTHPLNRGDLPFITLSGIIDGDFATNPHGNFPFYIKAGFEGLIKQGTPIMQLIPFKQDSWISEKTIGLSKVATLNSKKSNLVFSGWYKKNYWTRKDYS